MQFNFKKAFKVLGGLLLVDLIFFTFLIKPKLIVRVKN